jgi:hypothetical protein
MFQPLSPYTKIAMTMKTGGDQGYSWSPPVDALQLLIL